MSAACSGAKFEIVLDTEVVKSENCKGKEAETKLACLDMKNLKLHHHLTHNGSILEFYLLGQRPKFKVSLFYVQLKGQYNRE